jgi:hypothetical protein
MMDRLVDLWADKGKKRSKLWRWMSYILIAAMFAYLLYSFTQGDLRLGQVDWLAYGGALLAVLGLYGLSLVVQFFTWMRIIAFYRKINLQDVDIYARTILMRSLPGGAWHWLGRISMYSGETETPTRVVVIGNFVEWLLITLCGLEIFLLTVGGWGYAGAVSVFAGALWLAYRVQPASRKWIGKVAEGCLWLLLYHFAWLLAAGNLFLLTKAVAGPDQMAVGLALKATSLSGSLGMLVTMLPSSLGVRELSLLWLLQVSLTPGVALLIALMLRIIYTVADVVWGGLTWLVCLLVQLRANRSGSHPGQ